ncbi:hypothetical protein [Massilibacterium senegalense]|uniref:hypothetical protein n=1 Tax=Massilibacterium senegalense TaxID=1632858 RepID=UPI000785D2BA|nr:hypothetical protein [Massilibacterium senegalense]
MACCSSLPEGCNSLIQPPSPPQLSTDCFVVQSLVCTKEVQKVAELRIPAATLGVIVDITGSITPLIQLVPDLNNIVTNTILIKDKVINTGFVPANITVAGIVTPFQVNLPFQQETDCPGACPEDTVTETPFQVEAIIIQGIAALGIGIAEVLVKVVMKTNITVTRPVIAQFADATLNPIQDVVPNRCGNSVMNAGMQQNLNTSTLLGQQAEANE